jgi:NADPH2:quinone reductase
MVPFITRAVRIHRVGGPEVLAIEDVALAGPGPNEVRIAVEAAGVNYPDLLLRSGALPVHALPYTPGFEATGTIEAVGAAVRGLRIGMRVSADLPRGGGYASHVIAEASAVCPIPNALTSDDAMALWITGRTALLLLRHARVAKGDVIFIPAALGGVGSIAVQLSKTFGARVVAGVGSDEKRERALVLGADWAVTYSRDGWADEVRRLTGGKGADVVLQTSGGAMGSESLRLLAPLGRLVMFGADNVVRPEALSANQVRSLLALGQSLSGFALMRTPEAVRRDALAELAERVASKTLSLPIQRFALSDVATAHQALEARRTVGKVVLTT